MRAVPMLPLARVDRATPGGLRSLASAFALWALASSGTACIEPVPAKDPFALRDVVVPEGNRLEFACVPTGPERCFDAVDDNCNGVIDEGCGLHTGILQFAVAWDAAAANVDLEVTDPSGELAGLGGPTAAGLIKDRECPGDDDECFGQNIENVYLAGTELERGRYRVEVKLVALRGASAPVAVRLGVRVGPRTYAMSFELSPGEGSDRRSFEFTL
jgi:hypothetical protein